MGDLLPFRKRRKSWTRPEDYAPKGWGRVLPESRWRGEAPRRGRIARIWRAARWWLALIVLATLWVLWRDAIRHEPPGFLEGESTRVDGRFERCAAGSGPRCVIDGDTLAVGGRTIRIVGLDAPELRGLCPAEKLGADRAANALLRWANAGPFELAGRIDGPTDKYGRDLMIARRTVAGREDNAAAALIAQGLARPYAGEARTSWC